MNQRGCQGRFVNKDGGTVGGVLDFALHLSTRQAGWPLGHSCKPYITRNPRSAIQAGI